MHIIYAHNAFLQDTCDDDKGYQGDDEDVITTGTNSIMLMN